MDQRFRMPPGRLRPGHALARALDDSGMDGERHGIELTESALTEDRGHSVTVLNGLRSRGLRIAMDDFGKGYSALTFLQRLPVDMVKTDRGFARGLPDDPASQSLARAIIGIAHGLGLAVVGEGVETGARADWLTREGCDFAQGRFFARPCPLDELQVPAPSPSSSHAG